MKITSPAFKNNSQIPAKYSCDGRNINPEFDISDLPKGVKSLVLIIDDPDSLSETWVHWILFNIDPKTNKIRENSIPNKAVQGLNSWRKNEYNGPCPKSGTHKYMFKLYALNKILDLNQGAYKGDVEKAMKGCILAKAQMIGLYSRGQ